MSRFHACALGLVVVGASLASSGSADAYVIRETTSGAPVRWPDDDVTVEVDPSLIEAVPDAFAAAAAAASGWTEADVGPVVHVTRAKTASVPAVDGRNVLYFIPGYPAAGDALAITLVTYDDETGAILDADVVINGSYEFAVLPGDARPGVGVTPVSNEPLTGDASAAPVLGAWPFGATGVDAPPSPFDLVHVVCHETGHVLGLRDAIDEAGDVMFLYSSPGDARRRTPALDDIAGVRFLYASASPERGCASAGAPVRAPAWLATVGLSAAIVASSLRRRRRPSEPCARP